MSLDIPGFVLLASGLTVSPGPATVLVLGNAARGGLGAGLATTSGVCCALFLHAMLSALGVSAVVAASSALLSALTVAGAAYLVWLGLRSLLRPRQRAGGEGIDAARDAMSAATAGRQGFLSNLLNPSTALFYLAILPQFAVVPNHVLRDSLTLAGIHFAISFGWLALASAFVGRARSLLSQPRVWRALDRLLGFALLGFGLRLALARA